MNKPQNKQKYQCQKKDLLIKENFKFNLKFLFLTSLIDNQICGKTFLTNIKFDNDYLSS